MALIRPTAAIKAPTPKQQVRLSVALNTLGVIKSVKTVPSLRATTEKLYRVN
jgi:hypothetical protein